MLEDETDYANLFNFLPESLNLPDEREELVNRIQQSDLLWIIKVGAAKQKITQNSISFSPGLPQIEFLSISIKI